LRPGLSTLGPALPCLNPKPVHFSCSFGLVPCHYVLDLHDRRAAGLVERQKPSYWISLWAPCYPVKLKQGAKRSSVECKCIIGFICMAWICSHLLNFPIECTVQFAILVDTASLCDENIMTVW